MGVVIAMRGTESEKIVNGTLKKVVPFVGADREGEFAQLGVGIIIPEEQRTITWGLFIPHSLVRSWRGMKILEQVESIDRETLCACWSSARNKSKTSNDTSQDFLNQVLVAVPNTDELNTMIINLRDKGVSVDSWELEEEIRAGRIVMNPLIETLIREDEECRQAYQREEEEINKPLPPEESLGTFFAGLGIGNFIIGGGIGGYGIDWGHIEIETLDQTAKRDSFSKHRKNGHRLEHTTAGPETTSSSVASGITMHRISFGEIEQPWFQAVDGTRYTFKFAKFRDNHFHIKTDIQKSSAEAGVEGEYTISELRAMIGALPQKPGEWQNFFKRITSIFN